jgi:hypothetical protein
MPRSSDEIVRASLPIPTSDSVIFEPDETMKFSSEAISVHGDKVEVGQFILTDRRYVFLKSHGYKEGDFAEISGVDAESEYIVGLVTMGTPKIKSGWVNLIVGCHN